MSPARRSPFYTPGALGTAVFGATGTSVVTAATVASYNGVHLLAFLLIGFVSTWLVHEVELHPVAWYLAFSALLMIFFMGFVVVEALGRAGVAQVSPWVVLAGTIVAAASMAADLRRSHRATHVTAGGEGPVPPR